MGFHIKRNIKGSASCLMQCLLSDSFTFVQFIKLNLWYNVYCMLDLIEVSY